ncbi:D-alanyl-D-alanine carboxypeptidase family protein [Gorillibacterium massiliense]|uniref:D-alanyl-D-alanine carboxypeptidase family protein n=1 Tax=Gorillibacterium massiliense TaxID=1280390 RepID=UPI0006940920|nr:D-alanyl-D-alanine carboxypeptidase family protein [Gorillibacterium massiliense]
MKRIRWIFLQTGLVAVFLFVSIGLTAAAAASPEDEAVTAYQPIQTAAESAAMIDVTSGRILYSSAGDKRMRIASTTKIMTAIVAIENGNLSDQVTITKTAFGKEGSSIYLKLGEKISLSNLLYGLMLRSGNDAATAIAEHVGGSVDGFVYLMNRKAEELGMTNSHFMNPSGLDDDQHYSTANDMARLAAYALKNPVFREIVKTKRINVSREDQAWDDVWTNKNKMLNLFPGADGVKTGFTKLSRRCLVSSATRDGQQLAVVTLNDGNDWADHARLLNYGFETFPLKTVVTEGSKLENGLIAGQTFLYPAKKEEQQQFTSTLAVTDTRSADYKLGKRGNLKIYLSGAFVGSIPIYEDKTGAPAASAGKQATNHAQIAHKGSVSFAKRYMSQLAKVLIFLTQTAAGNR